MASAGPDSAITDLGADLWGVISRLHRLLPQRIRLPVPWAQARLLATIEHHGATRISDLAVLDRCSQPTMTNQVGCLEAVGLVTRTGDPGDARAVLICITPEGQRMLSRVRADRAAIIDPQLAVLNPEDRQALATGLDVLRRLIEANTRTRRHPNTTTDGCGGVDAHH
jgi:DNA-binding MarR family transcriptional regulator